MQLDLGWYVFRHLPFPSIFSPVVMKRTRPAVSHRSKEGGWGTRKAKEVGEKWGSGVFEFRRNVQILEVEG